VDDVLERAGILLDEDGEEVAENEAATDQPPPASTEELEKLSAFRDFVSGLDLDDLGGPA
jgi:hypothetical protein